MDVSLRAVAPAGLSVLPVLTARRRVQALCALMAAALIGIVLCLQYGVEYIPPVELARILMNPGAAVDSAAGVNPATIVWEVRLPRLLLAYLVGASLAAVGVALQALLRNPLADPYILGISSGAALGAALALKFGLVWAIGGFTAVQLCAVIFAAATIAATYRIAVADGRIPVQSLLLAGVIINAILSALILFLTSLSDSTSAFRLFFWLMGNLATIGYDGLGVLAVIVSVGIGVLCTQGRNLNLLSLGEDPAQGLGLDVEWIKRVIFVTTALLTGVVVAVSGLIGFVGMIVPHAVRMVLGPDHRLLLPASALVGGTFLAVADTVARSLLAPMELPVGVITALCGGPFFIYLLMSHRKEARNEVIG